MTNEEAAKMLMAKVECMKRDTSGIDSYCNNGDCNICDLCYAQGTMGEQREALKMAIEALEKQIPIQVGYKQKQYGEYFYCPECRHTVKWIRDYEYCAYCGKAIEFPDLVSKDTDDLWLTKETLEGE